MRVRRSLGTHCFGLGAILALIGACATTAPKAPEQSATDLALANRVYLALNADPWFYFRHVDVRASGGVVDLAGYVWSADALYEARQIAGHVPGVRQVATNRLELEREGRDNGVTR
ncbi:MAG TPA: BON domain-containing protein [Steroidobacteraceae bacterium]|jgi:osmotically-inducible protein OsmY|nr:BON domain-containing protein [Steroidobacteraceae bacterium]